MHGRDQVFRELHDGVGTGCLKLAVLRESPTHSNTGDAVGGSTMDVVGPVADHHGSGILAGMLRQGCPHNGDLAVGSGQPFVCR